jgi:hypothetical protein
MSTTTEEEVSTGFTCPECGKTFSQAKRLGAHRSSAHRVPGQAKSSLARRRRALDASGNEPPVEPTPPAPGSVAARVQEKMREVVAPLQQEADELDAEIALRQRELDDLRDARYALDAVLKRIEDPAKRGGVRMGATARKPNEPPEVSLHVNPTKLAQVEGFLGAHADVLDEGFTGADLDRLMRANPNGGKALSAERIRECLIVLHARGVIRLDGITTGGGRRYKLIGGNDGALSS